MENSNVSALQEEAFYERRDSRKYFPENQTLVADCLTKSETFRATVQDLSARSVFITTAIPVRIGEEIAITIYLPGSHESIKATGEVVRVDREGIAVEFSVIFSY